MRFTSRTAFVRTAAIWVALGSLPAGVLADGALRELPEFYDPTVPFAVDITIDPPEGVLVLGLEDTPPTGWTVSNISHGGHWDTQHEKVKWGPFFSPIPESVSYDVTPPAEATGEYCFSGIVSFDGDNESVGGDDCVTNGPPPEPATRTLPVCYTGDDLFSASLTLAPPAGTWALGIEESPPVGWTVSNISDGGLWDAVHEKIKWGPFFEPFPTYVTYEFTPLPGAEDEHCFAGTVSLDGINGPIVGDACLTDCPAGDFDQDGDVDLDDLSVCVACMAGPEVAHPPDCDGVDLDVDGDVDLTDFAAFQTAFVGGSR